VPAWVFIVVGVVAVVSRPIETRLWRAGRISDRTLAILLIGRFPVLTTAGAFLAGRSLPFLAVYAFVGAVPGLLMYRFVLNAIERARDRQRN
jgi:hypothetical protein